MEIVSRKIKRLRKTKPNKIVGLIRIMLGIIFIMTGLMKLFLHEYGQAFSIQLVEANIPFYEFTYWAVPILEILLGIILLAGYQSRVGTLIIFPLMTIAIYVHLTATNLGAFPSQPQFPYMPIMVIGMAIVVLYKGAGAWSFDYNSTNCSCENSQAEDLNRTHGISTKC